MKKITWLASMTTIMLGILLLISYILKKTIPMTQIYLGPDRITYSLYAFVLAMAGIIFYWLAKRDKIFQIFRYISYLIAFILIIGFQLAVFIHNIDSYRGFDWALENLIIGLLPIVIVISGLFILKGKKTPALLFTIIFSGIAIFHLVLSIKILLRLGRAFSSARIEVLLIYLAIILYCLVGALFNYKFYRQKK